MDTSVKGLTRALWPRGTAIPTRDLRCRACGRENEVQVSTAALEPASCSCGACGQPFFLCPGEPMTGLLAAAYQHPLDARALAALRAIPGFDRAVKWLMEQLVDRGIRLHLMGGALRCSPLQLPELDALLQAARVRLGLEYPVTLFVAQSAALNAYTAGVEERVVVIHSALLNELDDATLTALLGHELGHQHAEHGLYRMVSALLLAGGKHAGPLRLLSYPLHLALQKWSRCAELTCDRAGLLAGQDVGASIRLLLTLTAGGGSRLGEPSQLNLAEFVAQARELAQMEGSSAMDGILAAVLTGQQTHPFPAWRLMHLIDWVERGTYLELLAGSWAGAPVKRTAVRSGSSPKRSSSARKRAG